MGFIRNKMLKFFLFKIISSQLAGKLYDFEINWRFYEGHMDLKPLTFYFNT
jgi:hypothetical protein